MPSLFRLLRPAYAVMLASPYLVTLYYVREGRIGGGWQSDLLSAGALGLVLAGGYAINDACDVRYDRWKRKPGPVAAGELSVKTAAMVGAGVMLLGLALATLATRVAFAAVLAGVAVALVGYDLVSKRVGVWKEIIVGVLVSSTYLLAMSQVGSVARGATLPFFAAWMLLSAVAYEILCDVRDRRSDRLGGGGPRAIQGHPRLWLHIADGLMVAGAILLVGPAFTGCGVVYRIVAPVSVGLPLMGGLLARRKEAKTRWVMLEFLGVGLATIADAAIVLRC